jgi:hypothetical protein
MATGFVRTLSAMYLQGNAAFAHSFLGHHLMELMGR